MKAVIFLSLLALASAAPKQKKPIVWETTNNEFNLEKAKDMWSCPGMLLLWARGTDQEGNMGKSPGPMLAKKLRENFGDVQIQGINYPACIEDNLLPKGTTEAAIANMTDYVQKVWENRNCQYTPVVLAGYSQGAAVVRGAVDQLKEKHFWHIKAVVTFGDPLHSKHGNKFGNLHPKKGLSLCNPGDSICSNGTMEISDAHFDYEKQVQKAYNHITLVASTILPGIRKEHAWKKFGGA